jgi:serine kinase of HPr protein (carbohydrate metabolism regulator)
MRVHELIDSLGLQVLANGAGLDREVSGGYVCDLLSVVMGRSQSGQVWVTRQSHANVIAVASLKELAAVVLADGVRADAEALAKASEQKVVVLASELPAFELVGRLYQLGIRGSE